MNGSPLGTRPSPPAARANVSVALAAAFLALAGLVAAGAFTGVDQWGVDHLMPGLSPHHASPPLWKSVVPFSNASHSTAVSEATEVVTLPASFLIALALVLLGCRELWRRGERGLAVAFLGGFVLVNLAEVVGKGLLHRPHLAVAGARRPFFDDSFPSGHAARIGLLAALAWRLRPALAPWLAAYVAACAAMLVLGAWHTITDVAGGLLLAGLVASALPRPQR